jgi:hypothetical protein
MRYGKWRQRPRPGRLWRPGIKSPGVGVTVPVAVAYAAGHGSLPHWAWDHGWAAIAFAGSYSLAYLAAGWLWDVLWWRHLYSGSVAETELRVRNLTAANPGRSFLRYMIADNRGVLYRRRWGKGLAVYTRPTAAQ